MLHSEFAVHLDTVVSCPFAAFQACEHGCAGGDGAEVPCERCWLLLTVQGGESGEFAGVEDGVGGGELEDDAGVDGEDVEAFVVGVDDGGVVSWWGVEGVGEGGGERGEGCGVDVAEVDVGF